MQRPSPPLEPICDGLWGAQWDLVMGGLVNFRGRMTVIRLRSGGLVLHSPIPIDDVLAEKLAGLGPIEHIIAPSCLHHVHLGGAKARYPSATLWGPKELSAKRKDLTFDAVLNIDSGGEVSRPAWSDELECIHLDGNAWMEEYVFYHRATKTLVVTDLVFNIHEAKGWFTRMVLRMVGAYGKLGQSRMVRFTTKDRNRFRTSVEKLLEWEFERLVMAHGQIIEVDAKSALLGELGWLLDGARPQLTA